MQPVWLPLLDLLPALQAPNCGPLQHGYLQIEPDRIQQWAALLQRKPGQRLIALHWQGIPDMNTRSTREERSLPFEQLLPSANLLMWSVSIQKGAGSEQFQTNKGLNFVAGQKAVSQSMDFKDTAAVLANCDLLISSDSAVALGRRHGNPHLACTTLDSRMALGLGRRAHGLVRQRSPFPATTRWRLGCRDSRHDCSLDAKKAP